jgi:hypothetical protein
VLSTRGAVLALGAGAAGLAGLLYGVEEFVLMAMSVGVLLAVGAGSAWRRQRVCRRSLRLVVRVPVAEVTARQSAVVELTVTSASPRRRPPVLVEDPRDHWSVSYPGLGESSLAGARQSQGPGPAGGHGDASDRWLGGAALARDRRQRARERRAVAGAQRLADAAAGADTVLTVFAPTRTRGLLTLSGVGVWCEDPFRLVARRVGLAPPAHVIVYPTPADVWPERRTSGPRPGVRERPPTVGAPNALSGDELSGLRPYAPGDRLTRLHWPSLARSGELVVREFVEPQTGSLTLLVDLRPSSHTTADSIEATISRAAGYGLRALHQGITVELCTSTGDRMVITPDTAGRQTMQRALALLGPASAPPAVARRWGDRPIGGAVWATGNAEGADVVLVTTATGAARQALPDSLGLRAETVLVP